MPMKHFIDGHQVVTDEEALELALGTPLELWLGVDGETPYERSIRLQAARDILADDPGLFDRVTSLAAELLETKATALHAVTPLTCVRRAGRSGASLSGRAA
ncbi:hypothetical protein AN219_37580 [Streptomyces nanshensis]|nr:hypothetical protein AN219_37580 [Streptomyces nanshensis]